MNKLIGAIAVSLAGSASAEPVTIAALGDSLTQGYGLAENQGFVPQLQRWLDARGAEVELINAGVSGDTTAGGLARVEWTLTDEVDAMIVALGANDLLRGIAPEVARENIDGILQAAQARDVEVLLIGMDAPGNYGPEYKADFDALYPELAEAYGTLHLDSFFAGLPSRDPGALGEFMQSDGLHPNPDGVARIVEAIGPHVLDLVDRAAD